MNEDKILEKLDKHATILEEHSKKLDSHTGQLESITKTVNSHTGQLEVIASTVLEHTEKLKQLDEINEKIDNLPTSEKLDETLSKVDELLGKAINVEQEGIMRTNAIKRIEEKADKNTEDIKQIKPLVGLA